MSIRCRRLGSSELIVSEIGIGCQPLGGDVYHGDSRQAVATLDGVSVAIPRVATRSQLGEVLGSLSAPPLSARELFTIAALWQQSVRPVSRYACRTARGQGHVDRP